jgi:hypothetical protein
MYVEHDTIQKSRRHTTRVKVFDPEF